MSNVLKALKPKPDGGRKHENMTLRKALLARFARAAGAGENNSLHQGIRVWSVGTSAGIGRKLHFGRISRVRLVRNGRRLSGVGDLEIMASGRESGPPALPL